MLAAVLVVGATPGLPARAAAVHPTWCTAPATLTRLGESLPHASRALARRRALRIVAIGSSSTEGVGASAPDKAYPAQLQAVLAARLPGMRVAVFNKGVGGETAGPTLARFPRDVVAVRPDLVIWQVGSNEILRRRNTGADLARYRALMQRGLAILSALPADVIVMDQQFSPTIQAQPDHGAFVAATDAVALHADVGLFPRYRLMRFWGGAGAGHMTGGDGVHMTDAAYGCLAELLADAILDRLGRPAIAGR